MRDTQGAKTIQDVTVPRRVARGPRWFVLALAVSSQVFFLPNGTHGQVPLQPAPDPRVQIFDDFAPYPSLPQPLHDGSAGTLGNHLIYAGGRSPAEGSLSRDVYALAAGADTWQQVAELPYGLSHGAAIVWGSQLLIVGGMRADGASAEILQLGEEESGWNIRRFASLPQPMMAPSVALIEDPQRGSRFFAASGALIFELDANHPEGGWTESQPLPVTGPVGPCQLLELDGVLFAFGSAAGAPFALEYTEQRWQAIASPPPGFQPEAVVHSGDAHLLFVGPSPTGQQIFTYHRLTDSWARWGDLPDGVSANRVLTDSNGLYLFGNPAAGEGAAPTYRATFSPSSTMHIADYIALLLYFGLMVVLGVFFARRNKNTETYFEGGRNVAWLAVGMSMFATGASSISFMAMPAKAFAENWKFFLVGPLQCLILPISLFIFIPILRRERISTAYEYLERRFSSGLRLLGASFFAVSQVFVRIAVVMYLPAIAMEAFTGIDKFICILIMGGLATLYTTMGGIEAVIWTDVLQGLVMIIAVMLSFGAVLYQLQLPVGEMWDTAQAYHKFHMIDWGLSFQELTIWVMLVSMLYHQAVWCGDQNYVQRVQSVPTERHARKAAISQLGIAIPINVLFFGLGTMLFLLYRVHPDWLHVTTRNDAIFPYFVVQNLPIGLTGIIIAALFAASMSSLDSSINSSAMVLIHDFYKRFKPETSEADTFRLAHKLSLILGVLGTGAALLIASLDRKSAWDLFIELSNLSAGSMLGIYTLGYFTKRANSTGAWIGWVIGNVVLFFVWQYTSLNPWLFGPVGIGACFVGGYLASLVFRGASEVRGLTAFTISPPSAGV
jgi:SSS family solute:Na+ symporter